MADIRFEDNQCVILHAKMGEFGGIFNNLVIQVSDNETILTKKEEGENYQVLLSSDTAYTVKHRD